MSYLVINNKPWTPFGNMYRVFKTKDKAIEYAKAIGWKPSFFSFTDSFGVMNAYRCGDIDVGIIKVENE